jgi:uncharacterized protein YbjT (DUF2867 family)
MTKRILVIGSTGNVGRELVARLVERGVEVRAATRRPALASSQPGVEPVEFDFERPSTFAAALAGVDRVFLMARPGDEQADQSAAPLLAAMRLGGVRHVVNLTALGVDRLPATALWRLERAIEDSGLGYTHLRPNWFMQVFTTAPLLPAIRATGVLRLPAEKARISFIDVRDLADVAREALLDDRHAGQRYALTGAESLDHSEVAELISQAADRPVEYVSTIDEEARRELGRAGFPPERVERLLGFYRLVRQGFSASVSPDVATILGRPPRSMREFARDNAALWR